MMYDRFILIYPMIRSRGTVYPHRKEGIRTEKLMKLHTLGIGYRHESGFWIDRPGGSGDNLLLIFGSPARVVLPGGEYHVPPQSAVLYRRGTRQSYGSDGGVFVNHWLHLECPEEDPIFQILPFDTVICVSPAVPYEDLMTRLSREQLSESPYKERYADLLIRMLLLKLGEGARPGNAVFPAPARMRRRFKDFAPSFTAVPPDRFGSPSSPRVFR